MIVAGLDMSLTATGVCVISDSKITLSTVRTSSKQFDSFHDRLDYISKEVFFHLPKGVDLVCIEETFIPKKNSSADITMKIIANAYMIRRHLDHSEIRRMEVAASQLKKFALGTGKGEKDQIMMQVLKRWDIETADNNQADAVVLAKIAEAIVKEESFMPVDLIQAQQEVVQKVREKHG